MRSFSSRVPWVAVAGVAAALGCASVDEPPPVASAFPEVKSAALVRSSGRGADRGKDALDALAASLTERGITTRAVELRHGGAKELREVERLYGDVESRVESGSGHPGRSRAAQPLGAEAARTVRALGVDAIAMYVRFDERFFRSSRPPGAFGSPPPGTVEEPPFSSYRPAAALALVGRDGMLVWFDWGPREETRDPEGPVNAAEAVEAAARLLAGEPEDA